MVKNVLSEKVVDNKEITMTAALEQLLPHGKRMSIAVGYFFLGGYELIREDFNRIAMSGGVRIIIGNRTDLRTSNEINEGVTAYRKQNHTVIDALEPQEALFREVVDLVAFEERLSFAAYQFRDLIRHGKVKVKVYTGKSSYFHSKLYLIERHDEYDGFAFVGSSNFSKGGLTGNSELNVLTMDSYPNLNSWFDGLWNSDDVEEFDSSLMSLIEKNVCKPSEYIPPEGIPFDEPPNDFMIPLAVELRDYQKDAIREWFRNEGRGILEMATGTGKTKTALSAAAKLYEHKQQLALVIVCPYQHLVVQWQEECREFGLNPILGYEARKNWENDLNSAITSYNSGAKNLLCLITTVDTFASSTMQATLAKVRNNLMLLVDECHHLGAPKTLASLGRQYTWRLGLSATPQRWYDDAGSKLLAEFFENGVIYQYTLKDAIGKYLTRYFYYPHLVYLTENENEEYLELSEKIARIYAVSGDASEGNDALKLLLMKRARIINKAENKLSMLLSLIKEERDSQFNLFYCGDSIEDGVRQVDQVIYLLGHELGMKVHPFTSQESKKERVELLSRFSRGDLQGLVAIRCLDEGVDVPATKTAYILASSTNPREFVQRRGRILRKSPGKDYAYIHDFIVVPRDLGELRNLNPAIFNIERKLMRRELMRFKEFAELAENGPQAMSSILEVAKSYNLMDI